MRARLAPRLPRACDSPQVGAPKIATVVASGAAGARPFWLPKRPQGQVTRTVRVTFSNLV